MYNNLRKAWRCWGVMSKVLTKTRATVWDPGMIYKSVVKTVILYGRESWVVKEYIMKVLEALNN